MLFRKIILPSGKYNSQYIPYIKWSFLSNICVSAETAISIDNMLFAVNSNSDTVRTINYIGKDIIGQVGGLIYLTKFGSDADKDPKDFLLKSNILQQTSILSMAVTPLISNYFLPIAGLSNVLSNLSFTGFGAINAKCIGKISEDNNVGEIYSKISVINMSASSIGLLIGLLINIYFPDANQRLAFLPILGLLRIYTMKKAIKNLV